MATVNPATGELLRSFEPHSGAAAARELEKGARACRLSQRSKERVGHAPSPFTVVPAMSKATSLGSSIR